MISPHGRRGWVTTCVGGRVRPPLPPGRAVALLLVTTPLLLAEPLPAAEPLPPGAPEPVARPDPPRGARASSVVRSLATASPRYGARGRRAGWGALSAGSLGPA